MPTRHLFRITKSTVGFLPLICFTALCARWYRRSRDERAACRVSRGRGLVNIEEGQGDVVGTAARSRQSGEPQRRQRGDLAKHSVYAGTLRYLPAREPWSTEIRVRERHAGRGVCAIPRADERRPLLGCLLSPCDADSGVALHDLQFSSQSALGVWPSASADLRWYSGSAVLSTYCLGEATGGVRQLDLYELSPETRRVLRAVFYAPAEQVPGVSGCILPEFEDESDYDGERHIESSVAWWVVPSAAARARCRARSFCCAWLWPSIGAPRYRRLHRLSGLGAASHRLRGDHQHGRRLAYRGGPLEISRRRTPAPRSVPPPPPASPGRRASRCRV